MRNLVTLQELQEIDSAGLLDAFDSTNIENAIELASYEMISRCGHDFGFYEGACEIDAQFIVKSAALRGVTRYPLSELTAIQLLTYDRALIRDVDVSHTFIKPFTYYNIDEEEYPLFDKIRFDRVASPVTAPIMTIYGSWGFPLGLPLDVKKALLSLVVTIMNETGVVAGGFTTGGSSDIKRIRRVDGTEIEYFEGGSIDTGDSVFAYDRFAERVAIKYTWKKGWSVI